MENRFFNVIIGLLVFAVLGLVFILFNTTNHGYYAFTVENSGEKQVIGKYSTYQQCQEDYAEYIGEHLGDTSDQLSTCEWKSN